MLAVVTELLVLAAKAVAVAVPVVAQVTVPVRRSRSN